MQIEVTQKLYRVLVQEDIRKLRSYMEACEERDHIEAILQWSVYSFFMDSDSIITRGHRLLPEKRIVKKKSAIGGILIMLQKTTRMNGVLANLASDDFPRVLYRSNKKELKKGDILHILDNTTGEPMIDLRDAEYYECIAIDSTQTDGILKNQITGDTARLKDLNKTCVYLEIINPK